MDEHSSLILPFHIRRVQFRPQRNVVSCGIGLEPGEGDAVFAVQEVTEPSVVILDVRYIPGSLLDDFSTDFLSFAGIGHRLLAFPDQAVQ